MSLGLTTRMSLRPALTSGFEYVAFCALKTASTSACISTMTCSSTATGRLAHPLPACTRPSVKLTSTVCTTTAARAALVERAPCFASAARCRSKVRPACCSAVLSSHRASTRSKPRRCRTRCATDSGSSVWLVRASPLAPLFAEALSATEASATASSSIGHESTGSSRGTARCAERNRRYAAALASGMSLSTNCLALNKSSTRLSIRGACQLRASSVAIFRSDWRARSGAMRLCSMLSATDSARADLHACPCFHSASSICECADSSLRATATSPRGDAAESGFRSTGLPLCILASSTATTSFLRSPSARFQSARPDTAVLCPGPSDPFSLNVPAWSKCQSSAFACRSHAHNRRQTCRRWPSLSLTFALLACSDARESAEAASTWAATTRSSSSRLRESQSATAGWKWCSAS
mmetsp:Transcript_58222/g.137018  ORF Transcript_58222/g.137018 Transcript_58222/m.137018 type:complete len:411 (-) Transcript_58222:6-1238(-)